MDNDQLYALVYQALETEKGAVLIYEAAIRCALNANLIDEWKEHLDQTQNHFRVLVDVCNKLGLNPDQETPGRNVVRHAGQSLMKTMEIALLVGTLQSAEVVAAECVAYAQTRDHMNWQLLGAAAQYLEGRDRETLQTAYDEVAREEGEHLRRAEDWVQKLHLQLLGLSSELLQAQEDIDLDEEATVAVARG